MESKQINLIYFSATGTTRKVLESIAEGFGATQVEHINLTLPGSIQQTPPSFKNELAIIGAPVYGGRLPVDAIDRLKRLKANDTPTVLIVVYGNREFDDALLELKNLSIELGFQPIAAAAFIGEHSFASEDIPIANGNILQPGSTKTAVIVKILNSLVLMSKDLQPSEFHLLNDTVSRVSIPCS